MAGGRILILAAAVPMAGLRVPVLAATEHVLYV
jgi:hypothetical protein